MLDSTKERERRDLSVQRISIFQERRWPSRRATEDQKSSGRTGKRKESAMIRWRNILAFTLIVFLVIPLAASSAFCAEKVLKVGVMGPMTGPSSKVGEEFRNSTEMAFDKIGYKIGDYKIEIVWVDSQSDPAKATNAYSEAVERGGIQAGIMNWHSSVAVAVMEVTAQYKIPHFGGMGAASTVNEKWVLDLILFTLRRSLWSLVC